MIFIKNFFKKNRNIYIYGAGRYAYALKSFLDKMDLSIMGFIVSDEKLNKKIFLGMPIYNLKDISCEKENCGIIFALSDKYHASIENNLVIAGFRNYLRLTNDVLEDLSSKADCFDEIFYTKYNEYLLKDKGTSSTLIKNILIIKLDGIGDFVLLTPFIRELRKSHIKSNITLVVNPTVQSLAENCPYVDDVIAYDGWVKSKECTLFERIKRVELFAKRIFVNKRYDLAIVPRWDEDSYGAAFLTFFSKAKRRIAFSESVNSRKRISNKNFDRMFTEVFFDKTIKHEVEHNLYMLKALGYEFKNKDLELWSNIEDRQYVREMMAQRNIQKDDQLIGVGISAQNPKRVWDFNNYKKLINYIGYKNKKCKFFLLGGPEAIESAQQIVDGILYDNTINLVNQTTLMQIAALLENTHLYIGNDTGIMHMAAAMDNFVCEISSFPINGKNSSPNSIKRFGPWGRNYLAIQPKFGLDDCVEECNKNYAHCINTITVTDVIHLLKVNNIINLL